MLSKLRPDGVLLIGDIIFATQSMEETRQSINHWDDSEFYWIADKDVPALKAQGWQVNYLPISFCGGVLAVS